MINCLLTEQPHEELLASCYSSCLSLAEENGIKSVAFCCISTGVFMFPNRRAAEIAVQSVRINGTKAISVIIKHGASAKGAVGLYVDIGTDGFFKNLTVENYD